MMNQARRLVLALTTVVWVSGLWGCSGSSHNADNGQTSAISSESSAPILSSSSESVVSSVSSSSAPTQCESLDTRLGESYYLDGPVNCTRCHGRYDGEKFSGGNLDIDPDALLFTTNDQLQLYLENYMTAGRNSACDGDEACLARSQALAAYINSLSTTAVRCDSSTSSQITSAASSSEEECL